MREIRKAKCFTIQELADRTGVSSTSIGLHEKGQREINDNDILKIAEFLGVTVEALNEKCEENTINKKCLNEACPLNKSKKCNNDVVLSGKAPCYGKDKVQLKEKKVKFNSTKALFVE
jgi:transcriptional regulator with XRE-family HTH domain